MPYPRTQGIRLFALYDRQVFPSKDRRHKDSAGCGEDAVGSCARSVRLDPGVLGMLPGVLAGVLAALDRAGRAGRAGVC
jgi:hypothetical protein